MANYIGKISAVVTANVSDVAPKLSASAREWDKYGKRVQASIDAARRNARSSFDQIFTAQQRLERAFASSRNTTLKIDTREGEDAIRRLIAASQELARPLVSAQKQFSSLSSSIQNEFGRALSEAQNAARSAAAAINETGRLGEQSFERYKRRVDEAVVSIRRLSEANAAVGGLATGRELRFQQAGFAAELQRTSALQSQASALPADARASGAVAQLVELQRREADEAARLLAVLENVRNTRRGDAAAAQANLDAQTQRLAQVNLQLERQVALYNEVEQRQRQTAAAASQVAARESATELNRRDGTLARRNAAAFVESTASLVSDPEIARRQKELERSSALRATFSALPADAQASLERQRQQFENIAISAEKGAVSVGILADANDRLAVAVEGAREASADQQRRREFATALLPPVVEVPSQDQQRSDLFGPPVDVSDRRLGVLQGAINSVKGAVDQLPIPLQTRFVPLLARAEANFIALRNSGAATAAEIAKAARDVEKLERGVKRTADAASLLGSRDVLRNLATREAVGQLDAAGRILAQVGAQAGGPVAAAYDELRKAQARFIRQGIAETPQAREEIVRLQKELARVAAETGRISFSRAFREIQRGGDLARKSFSNVGLAIGQAAFIVDDFFSVTGGIEQRLRAVGNNISQLGFLIGGTYGLIAGVAVSAGSQIAIAFIKYANAGRTTEIQAKALNEAFQKQKSLAQELAAAFSSLGQTIASRGFSPAAAAASELSEQLARIIQLQQKVSAGAVARTSQDVANLRADQDIVTRRLESDTSRVGGRLALERNLELLRQREARQAENFANAPAPGPEDIQASIRRFANLIDDVLERRGDLSGASADAIAAPERLREIAAGLDLSGTDQGIRRRIESLQSAVDLIVRDASAQAFGLDTGFAKDLQQIVRAIEEAKQRLAAPFDLGTTKTLTSVAEDASAASANLEQAQNSVQESIERGVVGADRLAGELDAISKSIKESINTINQAVSGVDAQGNAVTRTPGQLRDIADRERGRVEQLRPRIEQALQEALGARLSAESRVDRAGAAQQTLQSTAAFANEYAGLTARLQRAAVIEEAARKAVAAANNEATRADRAAARAALDLATAAAEAAIAINAGFDRFRTSIQSLAQETQRAADEAQRRVNQAEGVGGPSVRQLERDRDRIEENLEIDQRFVKGIESQLQAALAGLSNDPEFQRQSDRLNQLRNEAEAAAARAIQTNVPEDPRVTVDRANQIARAEQALDEIRKRSQEGIQKQAEAELRLRAARDRQEEFLRADRDRRQPTGDAVRGLDIIGGTRERALNEFRQRSVDIEATRRARDSAIRAGIARGQGDARDAAAQRLAQAQANLRQSEFTSRLRSNLRIPARALLDERSAATERAVGVLSVAQTFQDPTGGFAVDLPRGSGSVEQARDAIGRGREIFQQLSLLGKSIRPEDLVAINDFFPASLSLDRSQFTEEGLDDAGIDVRSSVANFGEKLDAAAAALDGFVRAGQPSLDAAQAEFDRSVELLQEADRGLEEVDRLRPDVRADQAVKDAQAAFDAVNKPFADLEKNEREAAQARLRAIQDITDLGLSDQQKFANGLQDSLGEVQAQAEEFLGAGDRRAALESLTNAQNNLARQNAPLFAQFSDEVANAVLQGPSRAALQVSDASTSEGQRELNRLLRGDDAARDVNLVELQKQSTYLQSIDTGISTLKERLGIAQ